MVENGRIKELTSRFVSEASVAHCASNEPTDHDELGLKHMWGALLIHGVTTLVAVFLRVLRLWKGGTCTPKGS